MTKSLIIGCGNLGQNIISGFYKKKKKILICDKNEILLKKIKKNYNNFFEVKENLKMKIVDTQPTFVNLIHTIGSENEEENNSEVLMF